MLAKIGKDARFLAFLFEALERAFKVFVVMDDDFRQYLLPPFVAFLRRCRYRVHNLAGPVPTGKQTAPDGSTAHHFAADVTPVAISAAGRQVRECAGGAPSGRRRRLC